MNLVRKNLISFEEAKAASSNPEDFHLRYKGVSSQDGHKWKGFDSTQGGMVISDVSSIEMQPNPKMTDNVPIPKKKGMDDDD